MRLADGYTMKRKLVNGVLVSSTPTSMADYRPMTFEEAKTLKVGDEVYFLAQDGTARRIRVSGQPKTWKRDPNRFEIPMKYGMYESARFSWDANMKRMRVMGKFPPISSILLIKVTVGSA